MLKRNFGHRSINGLYLILIIQQTFVIGNLVSENTFAKYTNDLDLLNILENFNVVMFRAELTQMTVVHVIQSIYKGDPVKIMLSNPTEHYNENSNALFVIYERLARAKKCLLVPDQLPKPVAFRGITIQDMVSFINNECNLHRDKEGNFNKVGLYEFEVLSNLFSVRSISNYTLKDFEYPKKSSHGDIYYSCKEPQSCTTNIDQDQLCDDIKETHIPNCDRVSAASMTQDIFFHDYLVRSKPFVLTGATKHWNALHKWSNDYLKSVYGSNKVHVKLAPGGTFEGVESVIKWLGKKRKLIPPTVYKKLQFPELVVVRPAAISTTFGGLVSMTESDILNNLNVSAYLEYSSIPKYLPRLREDIEELEIVKELLHLQHMNVWYSNGNTTGKLHFDPFDNFLCPISGTKDLILFDPHRNSDLYEGHIQEAQLSYEEKSMTFSRDTLLDSTSMVMSPIELENVDLNKFKQAARATPMRCHVGEGDALFLPSFWWHEVISAPSKGRNLAVNFWYDPMLTKEYPCSHCKLRLNRDYLQTIERFIEE